MSIPFESRTPKKKTHHQKLLFGHILFVFATWRTFGLWVESIAASNSTTDTTTVRNSDWRSGQPARKWHSTYGHDRSYNLPFLMYNIYYDIKIDVDD